MAWLILLNGPPAIGKSTLAERYVDEHPLALNLDLDGVRRMLGQWQERPIEAGLLARAMTLEMARVHLSGGHDVVIPQYLGRPQFLQQAEQVATEVHAKFAEFVLMDGRDNAVRRFTERTAMATAQAHIEAGRLMDKLGGQPALEAMYDRLLLVLSHRPHAQVIQSREGAVDETYAELRDRLAG
ncbi:MAG TPA: AAA family ATPase [Jatrophihabitantaceae bacterium]|jgi:predicted kinase